VRRPGEGWRHGATSIGFQYLLSDPDAQQGLQVGATAEHGFADGGPDSTSLSLGAQGGRDRDGWAANVGVERIGDTTDVDGSVGYRRQWRAGIATSVELVGSLQRADGLESVVAMHVDTSPGWSLKAGLGALRDGGRTSATAHIELLLRLDRFRPG